MDGDVRELWETGGRRDERWRRALEPVAAERLRDVRRILLIRLRAMGDVILALPAARALRRRFPEAELAMLVEEPWAPLLAGNPDLDEVWALPAPGQARGPARWRQDVEFAGRLCRHRFDLVVDLFGNPRSAFLAWRSGARLRVGYDVRGRRYAYHVRQPRHVLTEGRPVLRYGADVNVEMVRPLGADVADLAPRVHLTGEEREEARGMLRTLGVKAGEEVVAMLPAGSWPAKTWPAERFAELGDLLARRPATRVLLLWGPGERELAAGVGARMKQPFLLSPPRTVRELAALLSAVRLLIGNDSGPKHLAAAVGTPTLTVYGPTDPRTWSPRGPAHLALQHEVTCGPCDRTSCPDLRCLLSVSAGRMAAWAQSALARGDTAPAPGADGGATRAR